jgi:hypothetical protein
MHVDQEITSFFLITSMAMIKVVLLFLRDAFIHLLCLCCEGLILGIGE